MKFTSRKNHVCIKEDRVVKRFNDEETFKRELSNISRLKRANVAVPGILNVAINYIEYEFINGVTYCALVECFEKKHALALTTWLEDYYLATSLLRGDVNLRNFLYDIRTDSCIGVDFEEQAIYGDRETDYGKIIAFAATYDPPFSKRKRHCAKLLMNEFLAIGADRGKIQAAYQAEIKAMNKRRRNKKYDLSQAERFWQRISE